VAGLGGVRRGKAGGDATADRSDARVRVRLAYVGMRGSIERGGVV
jgi:hypothetical protein